MNNTIQGMLLIGSIAVAPMAAGAQEVITDATTQITHGFRLTPGESDIHEYIINPPDKFTFNFSFSGVGHADSLALVTFGIDSLTNSFETIGGPPTTSAGAGWLEGVTVYGPFRVVYSLGAEASGPVDVTYYGVKAVTVPEIGAEGAVAALMLVAGGIAIIAGRRRVIATS